MKDIDFDELDKAVNSLMSGIPKTAPVKSDDVKTLTLNVKPAADMSSTSTSLMTLSPARVQPVSDQTRETAQATPTSPAASTMPLASRRGGRFMDVVHSSSDMKKPAPSQIPSRQGLTIEPRPRMPQTPVVADTTLVQQPETLTTFAVGTPSSPVIAPHQDAVATNDWPDPLEMPAQKPEPEETADNSTNVTRDELVTFEDADVTEQTAPLTSPFLAGAKVEKRPLGVAQQSTLQEEVEEPDHAPVLGALAQEDTANDDTDKQRPPEPIESDAPIPEELSGDLMAIESGSRQTSASTEAAIAIEQEAPTASVSPIPETTSQAQKPNGPSSISQQYKEELSTGDQTSGSIFDTAAYHQPLAHPAKHNSGWLWVIGVIAVLLLGAASGAALYYLGLV